MQPQQDYYQLYSSMLEAFDAVNLNYFVMEIICDENGVPADGIYREVSPATVKLIGKSQEDIIGKSRRELFGNINDEFPAKFYEVLKTGQPAHFQSHGAALNKHYDVYAWKVADREVAALIRDISGHKKAEEALQLSEERFSKAFNASPAAVSISRLSDGLLIDINTAYTEIFGFTREEAIGKTSTGLGIFLDPDDRSKVVSQLRESGKVQSLEVNFKTKTGKAITTLTSLDCIKIGGVDYMMSTVLDITERKKAEEALKGSEERFRSIFEKTAFGIVIGDIEGHIIESNLAFELMLGYTKEELYGKSFADFTHPGDLPTEQAQAEKMRLKKTSYFELDKRYVRKDCRIIWAHLGVSEVTAPNQNKMVIAVIEDITKRKKTEEENQKNNRKLELLASLTSRLLSHSNPQRLVQEICEDVMNFLDCDVFFNFMVDEQKGKLHLNAYAGVTQKTAEAIEWLSLGEAVCGCAAQFGKQIVCEDIRSTDDSRAALVRSFGVQAYAANPIYADEKVIGTLSFGTKKKPFFTEDELSLMKTVASQVSVAMQRKIYEEKLRQSEERFRIALKNAPVSVSAQDLNHRYIWAYNQKTASPDEIVGKTDQDVFKPEEARHIDEIKEKVLREGVELREQMWLDRPSGKIFLDVTWSPLKDQKGDIVGVTSATVDLTELKLAESALKQRTEQLEQTQKKLEEKAAEVEEYAARMEELVRERTEKLELSANYARELIETSLDPLVTISSEGKITDVNRATEIVTGCCREELIGSDFSDYFTEPKKAEAGYKKVLAEGYVKDYPLAIKSRTGETTDVLYNAAIYYDKTGKPQGVFAAARDITERKKLEKQLHEKDRLAAIGATAGMVGHDIRNPLQSIIGEVFLAKAELEGLPDSRAKKEIQENLNQTETNIDYINKIVQDLQDYARPLNPKAEDADLQQVFMHAVTQSKVPKNISTHIEVQPDARSIKTDTYYLNRILYNLITNSVQAMTNGGELTIRAYKESKDTVIAVSDTGAGIPKDVQPKMFTVMFTTKSKGQGFGLPVVKRMTESLGGKVSFESQEGKGTTFTLKVPIKA